MRVGFVQFHPEFGRVEQNLDHVIRMIEPADADLLVLPELFATGYMFPDRGKLNQLAEEVSGGMICSKLGELAKSKQTAIVFGLAEKAGDRIFNSAVCMTPTGDFHLYRKLHLFCDEKSIFDPGDLELSVVDIGSASIGMMICFDWAFPEVCRVLALKGAQIICNPANLVLGYCQDVMRARSIENGVFTITTNRTGSESIGEKTLRFTGRSQITNPQGEVLCTADDSAESVQVTEIDPQLADMKQITEQNDLLHDRRPEYYKGILPG